MRFSLDFVQEFLKVDTRPEKLASLLTMAGLEVGHLERRGKDWIFDVEVTSNRYDWLSILGIAREIAAVSGKVLKINYPVPVKKPLLAQRAIIIEDESDCSYYVGRSIAGVRVSGSPPWLAKKVLNCGLTSVSNIVDITNYVMLKWGNPLHAFDAAKLEGDIHIRRAKKGEIFLGIDSKERILGRENLVIADSKKVIAVAGIMGAKNTEVGKDTKNVFLEAALFSPLTVRRSRRALGLDTESSYRFERGAPPHLLGYASWEAAKLMEDEAGGRSSGYREAGRKPQLTRKKIVVSLDSLSAYLGASFSKQKVKGVLKRLDFGFKDISGDRIAVSPPVSRFDVKGKVDVYEEFSRIFGYDKIPDQIPFLERRLDISGQEDFYRLKGGLANFTALLGFKEVVTFSLEEQNQSNIELVNPLRSQENSLRSSLLCGIAKSIKHNLYRNQSGLRFFEIADVYSKDKKGFRELPSLALAVSGRDEDFFCLRGAVEKILGFLNIRDVEFKESSLKDFTNSLKVDAGECNLGFLGKLDQRQRKNLGLKEDLFFAQLDLSLCAQKREEKQYRPFSPYPAIWRDISIVLDKNKKFKDIEGIIREKSSYLAGLNIIDVYKGKDISSRQRAFTLRIFYQSSQKTLTSEEVDSFHSRIRQELSRQEGVALR